jgi:hypothetical protein
VANQLARAVDALDRLTEEDEDTVLIAILDALGPDGVELLGLVSDALREQVVRA